MLEMMSAEDIQDLTVVTPADMRADPQALHDAESLAVCAGIAEDLLTCPQCGALSGVVRTVRLKGTAFDFNASVNVMLHCGHWVV